MARLRGSRFKASERRLGSKKGIPEGLAPMKTHRIFEDELDRLANPRFPWKWMVAGLLIGQAIVYALLHFL